MFNQVKPGQRWQPKADELNAMIAAGAAMRGIPGLSQVTERPPGSTLIRVKNITGDAVQRYRAFGLGESLVAELEDSNRVADVVLELVEWESGPIAVIQTPLVDDEIGFAVVSGPTLLEVSDEGSDIDRQATPGTDGVCDPGSGPITLLMPRPEEGGFVLALVGVGTGGGPEMAFFRLDEDAGTTVLLQAIRGNYDTPGDGDPEEVVNWSGLVDNAVEGYLGLYAPVTHIEDNPDYQPDEELPDYDPREKISRTIWAFAQGACIPPPE